MENITLTDEQRTAARQILKDANKLDAKLTRSLQGGGELVAKLRKGLPRYTNDYDLQFVRAALVRLHNLVGVLLDRDDDDVPEGAAQ